MRNQGGQDLGSKLRAETTSDIIIPWFCRRIQLQHEYVCRAIIVVFKFDSEVEMVSQYCRDDLIPVLKLVSKSRTENTMCEADGIKLRCIVSN